MQGLSGDCRVYTATKSGSAASVAAIKSFMELFGRPSRYSSGTISMRRGVQRVDLHTCFFALASPFVFRARIQGAVLRGSAEWLEEDGHCESTEPGDAERRACLPGQSVQPPPSFGMCRTLPSVAPKDSDRLRTVRTGSSVSSVPGLSSAGLAASSIMGAAKHRRFALILYPTRIEPAHNQFQGGDSNEGHRDASKDALEEL